MGGYSGNLVRTYGTANDVRTPYPDKRHAGNPWSHDDDGSDQYPDAHRLPAGTGSEYDGTEIPVDQVVGGGLVLDDPQDTHDNPNAALYPIYTDDQGQQSMSAHEGDPGRAWVRSAYAAPEVQASHEVYGEDILQGFSPLVSENTQGAPALLRGINSYAMNNPDIEGYVQGVRPGVQRLIFNQRDRPVPHGRVYDEQPLAERTFTVPVNSPAPADPPMYGPVLPGWLPSALWHRDKVPGYWRNPGNVDDSLLAAENGPDSSVIGGDL